MSALNFDKRVILTLYKKFFGEDYPADGGQNSADRLKDVHIQAQKLCYLLKLRGLNVGDFGYSWNHYGPFSPGLQAQLREMDRVGKEIREFYQNYPGDQAIFTDEDLAGSLFMADDRARVEKLAEALEIPAHKGERRDWVELLGTLAYLANAELPGVPFQSVEKLLVKRKPQYADSARNRRAWDLLCRAGLVSARESIAS